MKLKQFYRYVFVFLLSVSIFTGCGSNNDGGTFVVPETNGTVSLGNNSSDENTTQENNNTSDVNTTQENNNTSDVNTTQENNNTSDVNTTQENNNTSDENTTVVTKTKGYLIDSPLQGVTYLCDGEENLTDENGMFECVNPPVTFKIGNLTLGTLTEFTADGKVYPQDLLGLARTNFTDSRLKLLARLVQSLDDDGDIGTKITITQSIQNEITTAQNFNDMSKNDILSLLSGLGKSLVKECGAMYHLGDKSLNCESNGDYYVAPDTTKPVITLNGASTIELTQGSTYTELGATATDDRDGNVSVSISGDVDVNVVGVYTVTYKAKDSAGNESVITRTVKIVLPPDITKPVITLNGANPIELTRGSTYTELGATATDDRDGNISVIISGDVDVNVVGVYTVTYKAKDSTGNEVVTTRTIKIIKNKTKGYLIDSPLQGVSYVCDGEENLTDASGMFECANPPVTFKIGNLTLGTLTEFTADGKVYPQDLLGLARTNFTDSRLKLLARLLQSLDDDGNIGTKITITESVRSGITTTQDFKDMSQSDVQSLLSGLGKSLVKECGALEHLGDTSVSCGSDGSYYVNTPKRNSAPIFDLSTLTVMAKPHTIGTNMFGAAETISLDMEDDGDMDVVASSYQNNRIVWYENNGTKNFKEHNISTTARGVWSIKGKDMDKDGDIDIISTSSDGNRIIWYENNGTQNFTEHNISILAGGAWYVATADIDKDGDEDVLSANMDDNCVVWYENDGSQNFVEHNISTTVSGASFVHTNDIDNDGDIDVFATSINDGRIVWYENDGSQNFIEHNVSTTFGDDDWWGRFSLYTIDINNDGQKDIVSSSWNSIQWYENDGSQNFIEHNISIGGLDWGVGTFAIDIDNDSDIDIFSSQFWFENNGQEEFTQHRITQSWVTYFTINDLDGDGISDIISPLYEAGVIMWYKNQKAFNISESRTVFTPLVATDIDGDNLSYRLSGEDASLFSINSLTGELTFIDAPSFENPHDADGDNYYDINISVTDGKETISQELSIIVGKQPILNNSLFTIRENSTAGYYVGRIDVNTSGSSPINTYRLEGEGSNDFVIDNGGNIHVAIGADIDYETKTLYELTAYASNTSGESQGADINISIIDINKPILVTIPIYSTENNISFKIQGDEDGEVLVINGVESTFVMDNTIQTITIPKDGTSIFTLQLKHADGSLSESVAFETFPTLNVTLTDLNMTNELDSSQRNGKYAKYYTFNINSKRSITIDMMSNFDTYLYLLDENRSRLYSNYDGGTGTNSKLNNIVLERGSYIIEATTYGNNVTGLFNLTVTDNGAVPPATPTLTTEVPSETTLSMIEVEVNGEVGSSVYVNGVEVATIGADGKASVSLNLNNGNNSFNITLQNAEGAESGALSFEVIKNTVPNDKFTFSTLNTKDTISNYDTSQAFDVAISSDGTKAFVADGYQGLKIIDISNPNTPILLSQYNTSDYANSIILSSDETKAFVADWDTGLVIIDISTADSPTLLASLVTDGDARDVALSNDGNIAVVADGDAGIQIIDISTPSSPILLGTYNTSGYAIGVTISSDGNTIFVADLEENLQIIDISTPSSPTLLGSYDTSGYTIGVTISSDGSKAFLAHGYDGLDIIDISNLSSPTLVGTYDTSGYARGVTLSSDESRVFIADDEAGLQIIDISNPSSPTLIDTYNTDDEAYAMVLSNDGSKAFVADNEAGLQIIDISNPTPSRLVSTYASSNEAVKVTLSKGGNIAYIAKDEGGLEIIDISNLNSPEQLATYDGDINNIVLSNDDSIAFLANGDAGLEIIDISTPSSPTLISTYDKSSNGYSEDVVLSKDGNTLFLSDGDDGLHIIDVSNPNTPTLIATYNSTDYINTVTLSSDGTKAFLASENGLLIVDITTLSSPTLLGTYTVDYDIEDIAISNDGTKAYIINQVHTIPSDDVHGLKIIDISNPSSPTLIGSYETDTSPYDITLSSDGNRAFIANYSAGVQLIDISTPSTPTLIDTYDTSGYALGVMLSKDETKIFVADGDAGLKVLNLAIDTFFEVINFEEKNIELKILSTQEIPLTMSVVANRDGIITIGNYEQELSFNDYDGQTINIPISSIDGALGQTILTISLTDGTETVTRMIYINVYP